MSKIDDGGTAFPLHDDRHKCSPFTQNEHKQNVALHDRACEAAQATDAAEALEEL